MTFTENDEVTLAEMSGEGDGAMPDIAEDSCLDGIGALNEDSDMQSEDAKQEDERAEYERLIKGRFKEFFAADTQKLINRRFKKQKNVEEKLLKLERDAARYADIDRLIAEERDRAVRETEERMNRQFRANRTRVAENALSSRILPRGLDVSKLTKSERALLATRAQKGETIHLK